MRDSAIRQDEKKNMAHDPTRRDNSNAPTRGPACAVAQVLTQRGWATGTVGITRTSSRLVEPEHGNQKFVWQIVCAYLNAHTKFRSKCSDPHASDFLKRCGCVCSYGKSEALHSDGRAIQGTITTR